MDFKANIDNLCSEIENRQRAQAFIVILVLNYACWRGFLGIFRIALQNRRRVAHNTCGDCRLFALTFYAKNLNTFVEIHSFPFAMNIIYTKIYRYWVQSGIRAGCYESKVLLSVVHFSHVSALWLAWVNDTEFSSPYMTY